MNEATRRNWLAVEQALSLQDLKISEQQQTIIAQNQGLAALAERVTQLEKVMQVWRVQNTSTGPSVR